MAPWAQMQRSRKNIIQLWCVRRALDAFAKKQHTPFSSLSNYEKETARSPTTHELSCVRKSRGSHIMTLLETHDEDISQNDYCTKQRDPETLQFAPMILLFLREPNRFMAASHLFFPTKRTSPLSLSRAPCTRETHSHTLKGLAQNSHTKTKQRIIISGADCSARCALLFLS
jgi:hypothetical protein